MTTLTSKSQSILAFLYLSVMGAVLSNAILLFVEGLRTILGLSITRSPAIVLGLLAVSVAAGMITYIKQRTPLYGLSIGFLHGVVGGIFFQPSNYLDLIVSIPVFTLLITPIPTMVAGLVGAFLGRVIGQGR